LTCVYSSFGAFGQLQGFVQLGVLERVQASLIKVLIIVFNYVWLWNSVFLVLELGLLF
jgi:hypothetical protein